MDISAQAVKIVQVSRRHRGITLDIIDSCALDNDVFVDGEIKNQLALHNALTSLLNKYKVSLVNGVVTCLSEAQTFLETINVPKEANKTFDEKLREVLPQYLPLVLEETYYDAKIVANNEREWRVCVGAASIKQVESYLELFKHLKITPLALDIEAGAVARAVLRETVPTHALAIIDLGSTHASMIIIENGTVQFTISMPIAG